MSDEHEGLAAWLQASRGTLLAGPAPGAHLDDERLAALAEGGGRLRRGEIAHLARCPVCREVAAAVVEAVPAAAVRRRRVWPWLVVPLAAAATLALVLLRPTPPSGDWQVRGGGPDAGAPDVAIVAHDAGARRVLLDGGRVTLGGRLSFRYGNSAGRARSLVILAWDGATMHAWYPERLDAPPFPLEPGAVGAPLPFDVELTPPHRAGPLTIAIAFDEAPAAVAARLRAGQPMPAPGQLLQVDVEAP